jgi:LuxR family transcriptional regulator, maltose regulon positive regulatory protein
MLRRAASKGEGMGATARDDQATVTRRERRIIERPRLIRLLDESGAKTILLLAPAGYGKTTLSRQWVSTLRGTIRLTGTSAHRDVVAFAEDVAQGLERLGGEAERFIGEYLRAQSNPQRSARKVALALIERLENSQAQWLVIDDYQELAGSPEVQGMVALIAERATCRLLVASRVRPSWVTARRVAYREISEIGPEELAMTTAEAIELFGGKTDSLNQVALQARGWPALLALAAANDSLSPPPGAVPAAVHRYLAEEIFQSAPVSLRASLLTLALLPELSPESISNRFGGEADDVVRQARDLGFLSGDGTVDLHPLLRDFLLVKLTEEQGFDERVRAAVADCVDAENWDRALELVLRFDDLDLAEVILEQAFKPLLRSGRLGTLSEFATTIRFGLTFPPPVVDVVDAEVAFRDGQLDLAAGLAGRVRGRLAGTHPLRSRADAILAQSKFLSAAYPEAEAAFEQALSNATDERDETEALLGRALARLFGERPGVAEAVAALDERRHRSPTHLVRCATVELVRRHFEEGLREPLDVAEARHALGRVDDPRARTSFTYRVGNALAQQSDYLAALDWLKLFYQDARLFHLDFALPYANWTAALTNLGLRRFGEAERLIQWVEDTAERTADLGNAVNASTLRARLLLQMGQPAEALRLVRRDIDGPVIPSWVGEYVATRALALACLDRPDEAIETATEATSISKIAEVRGLAATARSVALVNSNPSDAVEQVEVAVSLGVWDPVVCGVRSSTKLADELASREETRPFMETLYRRSNDLALARRAGFRTRATREPAQILSPRELEVLGLIARGLRNREISDALFIAQSTTKVHVRHILEKLGVRTRSEAVARLDMFERQT